MVDDHRLVADGIAALLGGINDFDVAAMTTWHELIDHADPPFDVVALDLQLGDGIRIGPKVRALAAMGTRTVVMSRHADETAVSAAMRAGAHAFVPKTDDLAVLADAIRVTAAKPEALGDEAVPDDDLLQSLGQREERALVLYASGMSIREVAAAMSTTEETVKSYIKRGRRKFRDAGTDLGNRALLRGYARAAGWQLGD